jgi:SAM-dependent methyltransferase
LSPESAKCYLEAQDKEASWNHVSHFGQHSENYLIQFGDIIKWCGYNIGSMADFGGNDGSAAFKFEEAHGVAPTVIDCLSNRLEYAEDTYGLDTIQCLLEDIPVANNHFDWGFCSHTIEHLYDMPKALKEMARVTRNMVYFICPMEHSESFDENEAHHTRITDPYEWRDEIMRNGFTSSVVIGLHGEAHVFARC